MMPHREKIVLLQLPIPQPGLEPPRGNVPLAAGYLKLYAQRQGLDNDFDIEIFPPQSANLAGDHALVDEILSLQPWMVGFSCYLWNINRSLTIVSLLKQRNPELKIVLGGPEITADNAWVLAHPDVDYAVIGEGEQTFAELLNHHRSTSTGEPTPRAIAGLAVCSIIRQRGIEPHLSMADWLPPFRKPLANLNEVSSPYLAGMLDAADEQMMMLETLRGCVFQCKFCYYPKSYDDLYFVSEEKIVANLRHAAERGAREVVLLDPTLNQRRRFDEFLRLLIRCNPDRQFRYFGELRAEGITPEIARLMRQAGFDEVEIGLQSIDPLAMELMDRKNNLRAFERGVSSLLDEGIAVKLDLIIGLPGDTIDSIRRGIDYIKNSNRYSSVQVFNLAILPGTAFRHEAAQHGLEFQPRPPYYVLKTPTLELSDLYDLLDEAEQTFETEFDALAAPIIDPSPRHRLKSHLRRGWTIDWDRPPLEREPVPRREEIAQAFSLWFQGVDLVGNLAETRQIIETLLADEPHATLQLIFEPRGELDGLDSRFFEAIRGSCLRATSYLDRFYSMQPGDWKGAKRIVILLPSERRTEIDSAWIDSLAQYASIVWQGEADIPESELEPHEYQSLKWADEIDGIPIGTHPA